jgi:hypothetical protein
MANVKFKDLAELTSMTDSIIVPTSDGTTTKKITGANLKTYMKDSTSAFVVQDQEVTFGLIGVRISNSSGDQVEIRGTSSYSGFYGYTSTSTADPADGPISLTTSWQQYYAGTTGSGHVLTSIISIPSQSVAYRVIVQSTNDSAPYTGFISIEKI